MALHTALDPRALAAALAVLLVLLALYVTFSGFGMVGITPGEVLVLLFLSPLLAPINLPVWQLPGVLIGVNAAGLGIPLVLSIRFIRSDRLPAWKAVLGTAIVTVVAYRLAEVVPEQGILVPALPLVAVAAAVGMALAGARWRQLGPVTYASGALGTLVGADLLHLRTLVDPSRQEPITAVIGGAGTLDAIFLIALWAVVGTIVAVLLARLFGVEPSRR